MDGISRIVALTLHPYTNRHHDDGLSWKLFPHRCPPLKSVATKQNNLAHFTDDFCNSNSMEILFCSNPNCSEVIATKFCTWQRGRGMCIILWRYDSLRCSCIITKIPLNLIYYGKKTLEKWVPGFFVLYPNNQLIKQVLCRSKLMRYN